MVNELFARIRHAGVEPQLRAAVWPHLSGAIELQETNSGQVILLSFVALNLFCIFVLI